MEGGREGRNKKEIDIREYCRRPELYKTMPCGEEAEVTLSVYLIFKKYLILLSLLVTML